MLSPAASVHGPAVALVALTRPASAHERTDSVSTCAAASWAAMAARGGAASAETRCRSRKWKDRQGNECRRTALGVIAPADLPCRVPVPQRGVDDPTNQRVGRQRASQGRVGMGLAPTSTSSCTRGDLARFARRPDAGSLPAFESRHQLRPTGSTETCSRLIPATHPHPAVRRVGQAGAGEAGVTSIYVRLAAAAGMQRPSRRPGTNRQMIESGRCIPHVLIAAGFPTACVRSSFSLPPYPCLWDGWHTSADNPDTNYVLWSS